MFQIYCGSKEYGSIAPILVFFLSGTLSDFLFPLALAMISRLVSLSIPLTSPINPKGFSYSDHIKNRAISAIDFTAVSILCHCMYNNMLVNYIV